jgi:membrane-bound lytic murein transglycosylase B
MVNIKYLALSLIAVSCMGFAKPSFEQYVDTLKASALKEGFSAETVNQAFSHVRYRASAVKSDKSQPEFKMTLDTYIPRAIPNWKVAKARRLYKENLPLLKNISAHYGVQPRFLVALWGIESNFGKLTGKFDVISALSTLAYDGRREDFFKQELFQALLILEEGHVNKDGLKGSWAGAMGQVQFMPSSFNSFAVDQDGNGRKDIWGSIPDALGSAANYLSKSGWNDDLTWGRRVLLSESFDEQLSGLSTKKTLAQWQALGVRKYDGTALPKLNLEASIVIPDDRNGRVYLAYDNYRTLMKWNRSNYFAVAVGTLADRIAYPEIK